MDQRHPLETINPSPVDDSSFPAFDNYQRVEDEYLGSEGVLHNSDVNAPAVVVLSEKPEHRMILYLKLQGQSNKEIATLTGYTVTWVRNIIKQPWFRKVFTQEAQTAGLDAVERFLEGEVLESLEVIREIRDNLGQKGNTRLAAANALLDRHLGRPTQKVITDNTHRNAADLSTEANEVDQEITRIEESLKTKGVA